MTFQLGDTVRWTSAARGVTKTKEGTIAEIVPAQQLPSREWLQLHRGAGVGLPRDHASYVVCVSNGKVYWPRVGHLKLAR